MDETRRGCGWGRQGEEQAVLSRPGNHLEYDGSICEGGEKGERLSEGYTRGYEWLIPERLF